jgi:hypothetical protein
MSAPTRLTLHLLAIAAAITVAVFAGPLARAQTVTPISQLPAATTPLSRTELVPIVQGGVTKQTPVSSIFDPTSPGALGTFAPNTGAFTTLTVFGSINGAGFTNYFAAPPPLGSSVPNSGTFTGVTTGTLLATGSVSGAGFNALFTSEFASPPPLGATTPNTIAGTTVNATTALNVGGQLFCSATLPTVTGTGLGTSPTVVASNACAMAITVGTSPAAASFTITEPTAPHGWACTGNDTTTQSTTVAQLKQVAGGSATTAVMENFTDVMGTGSALIAGDVLLVHCLPY